MYLILPAGALPVAVSPALPCRSHLICQGRRDCSMTCGLVELSPFRVCTTDGFLTSPWSCCGELLAQENTAGWYALKSRLIFCHPHCKHNLEACQLLSTALVQLLQPLSLPVHPPLPAESVLSPSSLYLLSTWFDTNGLARAIFPLHNHLLIKSSKRS